MSTTWGRPRARWAALAGTTALAALTAATLVYFTTRDSGSTPEPTRLVALSPAAVPALSPASVLAHDPYLGVACGVPNWIGCDRIGLAVWLRRRAISVRATVAGQGLRLDDRTWSGPARRGHRTMFAGFLQPAGLIERLHVRPDDGASRWLGSDAPQPIVRLWIDYGAGRRAETQLRVGLNAGWG
jgi:hypothetical protein